MVAVCKDRREHILHLNCTDYRLQREHQTHVDWLEKATTGWRLHGLGLLWSQIAEPFRSQHKPKKFGYRNRRVACRIWGHRCSGLWEQDGTRYGPLYYLRPHLCSSLCICPFLLCLQASFLCPSELSAGAHLHHQPPQARYPGPFSKPNSLI